MKTRIYAAPAVKGLRYIIQSLGNIYMHADQKDDDVLTLYLLPLLVEYAHTTILVTKCSNSHSCKFEC